MIAFGEKFQVSRVHAGPIFTNVMRFHPSRDRSMSKLVGISVCIFTAPDSHELPVAVMENACCPQPATFRLVDLAPKAFFVLVFNPHALL